MVKGAAAPLVRGGRSRENRKGTVLSACGSRGVAEACPSMRHRRGSRPWSSSARGGITAPFARIPADCSPRAAQGVVWLPMPGPSGPGAPTAGMVVALWHPWPGPSGPGAPTAGMVLALRHPWPESFVPGCPRAGSSVPGAPRARFFWWPSAPYGGPVADGVHGSLGIRLGAVGHLVDVRTARSSVPPASPASPAGPAP